VKKFFIRKFGNRNNTPVLDPEFAQQLAVSFQEILKLANSKNTVGPAAANGNGNADSQV
jgi:hypothetical protein